MNTKSLRNSSAVKLLMFCMALCQFAWCPRASAATDAKPTTPAEVFSGMNQSFKPDKAKGVHARYQFVITGPKGGNWWIIVNDSKCEIGKGTIDSIDLKLTVGDDDWVALANGKLSGMWAFLTGRLKVWGNLNIARKLDPMFSE